MDLDLDIEKDTNLLQFILNPHIDIQTNANLF